MAVLKGKSLLEVAQMEVAELMEYEGIGQLLAQRIYEHFRKRV
jgi:ERCC4-type nuclease